MAAPASLPKLPPPLLNDGAAFYQKLPQHGPMTSLFELTVAAYGEVRAPRENREQLDVMLRGRRFHLSPVFPAESRPLRVGLSRQPKLHGWNRRREIRKPNVVPIS